MIRNLCYYLIVIGLLMVGCGEQSTKASVIETTISHDSRVVVRFERGENARTLEDSEFSEFTISIPQSGRYLISIFGQTKTECAVWLEDYVSNADGRTYNITGMVTLNAEGKGCKEGSPLGKGEHQMKVHAAGTVQPDSIVFELMMPEQKTPKFITQKMHGNEWILTWSDEFEGEGLPDSSKWSYNTGNWGWGNNEPQYYTADRVENARQENGYLVIESHKNDLGHDWTSARLTTQGKIAFTYGKIEFRAKVPAGRGTWAAGWLLGDAYEDEISWPYCGEIDVLESVGFEIDDETGRGKNHATCHTRAYYFKQGNQIGSEIELDSMNTNFHTYAVEWYPNVIYGLIDGERYYTYDKNANELEWPFNAPQNIILNLAIGGGWGGTEGIDESYKNHQFILDYVRVYGLK